MFQQYCVSNHTGTYYSIGVKYLLTPKDSIPLTQTDFFFCYNSSKTIFCLIAQEEILSYRKNFEENSVLINIFSY